MIGLRHEKYGDFTNGYPFSLNADIERNPYNCSTEQNWHENIEIQLYTAGKGTVLIDGEKYSVSAGDIVTVNSNAVHYTYTDSYLRYTCLIISTEWCNIMNINYDILQFATIIKDPDIEKYIHQLENIYPNNKDSLRIAKLNEIVLHLIINLIENYSEPHISVTSKNRNFNMIKSTITFIERNYARKLSLTEISEAVFLDKYTLCKEFKKYTGKTIFEYLHQYRCIKAINYLSEGYTVAETAALCGFENLSFFTKIFKRYTGNNPSYYKK